MKKSKKTSKSALRSKNVFFLLLVLVALPVTLYAVKNPAIFRSGAAPAQGAPVLEAGFPVSVVDESKCTGTFGVGTSSVLIGDIDKSSGLEIVAGACSPKALYAWDNKGQLLAGWPVEKEVFMKGLPSLGNLAGDNTFAEVFSAFQPRLQSKSLFSAYSNGGKAMAGWPKEASNFTPYPAALYDLDKDAIDEVFINEEDGKLHCYKANGNVCSGWPSDTCSAQQRVTTPAVGDLDGNGIAEVFTTSGDKLCGYAQNGRALQGFPRLISDYGYLSFPVIGDINGDAKKEVVVAFSEKDGPHIGVYSLNGTNNYAFSTKAGISYWTAPALADLDGDKLPEIIVQGNGFVVAHNADGSYVLGWPVEIASKFDYFDSSPVAGDIDGDGSPDVVMTYKDAGIIGKTTTVFAFNSAGKMLPHFPLSIQLEHGGTPAIADIDLDGRNEFLLVATNGEKVAGGNNKIWAYDLHGEGQYGGVEWGQFMGGMKRNGTYAPSTGSAPVPGSEGSITISPTSLPNAKRGSSYKSQIEVKTTGNVTLKAYMTGLPKDLWSSCTGSGQSVTCKIRGTVSRRASAIEYPIKVTVTSSGGVSKTFTLPLLVK